MCFWLQREARLPLRDLLTIFHRFFIDFLSSEGRSPEARRRRHAEVAPADMFVKVASGVGKAVSFLLRISYILHNFPLLSLNYPCFPFLLLQVSRFCFWLHREAHFRRFSFRVSGSGDGKSFGFNWAVSFSPSDSIGPPFFIIFHRTFIDFINCSLTFSRCFIDVSLIC